METQFTETRTQQLDGYWHQVVYGLNIFDANRVPDELDPMPIIMGALAEECSCAAQIGWEPLSTTTAGTPEEYAQGNYEEITMTIDSTTPIIGGHSYERIPTGLYGGRFWYADKEWDSVVSDSSPEIAPRHPAGCGSAVAGDDHQLAWEERPETGGRGTCISPETQHKVVPIRRQAQNDGARLRLGKRPIHVPSRIRTAGEALNGLTRQTEEMNGVDLSPNSRIAGG